MRFNSKRISKNFDKKILIYGIFIMFVFSAVFLVNSDILQAGFNIGEENSNVYLKGVLYNNIYFTNSPQITAYNGDAESSFADDKILIDFDGILDKTSVSTSTYTGYTLSDNVVGILPLTTMELSTPYHVDINGNPLLLPNLATRTYVNSEGKSVYQYDYITTLKFTFSVETLDQLCYVNFNGGNEAIGKLAEWGSLENMQALIALSLPTVEGLDYSYDASISAYSLVFAWTGPDAKKDFNEAEVNDWLETNYPAYDGTYWDRTFIYNNEGIAPSISVNQPVPIDIVDSTKVIRCGLDRLFIPSVYKAYYDAGFLGLFPGTFHPNWYFMMPIIQFDVKLKILITDNVGIINNGTTTTTSTDPLTKPWWMLFESASEEANLAIWGLSIGGGIFIIVVFAYWKKQRVSGGMIY